MRLPRRLGGEPAARRPRFTEGLIAGALIGAAIAGSTVWARLRDARGSRSVKPGSGADGASDQGEQLAGDPEP